jgi:hypothetical protein
MRLPEYTDEELGLLVDQTLDDPVAVLRLKADIANGRAVGIRPVPLGEQPYEDRDPECWDGLS